MPRARLLSILALFAFPVAGTLLSVFSIGDVPHLFGAVAPGPRGLALLFAAQLLIAASGIVPASLLGVTAGLICGILPGFALAAVSTMAGALLTFAATRRFTGPLPGRFFSVEGRLRRFDALVARDGWKFVCLLRLSPVMPFAMTSYALSLSTITLRDYAVGTLASLPALLGYVAAGVFGKTVGTVPGRGGDLVHLLLLGAGAAATIAVSVRIGQLASRALARSDRHDVALQQGA